MGRTAPSPRSAVEGEIARLRRVARLLLDPGDRRALEELLECSRRALDAYKVVEMTDPLEPILVSMLICLKRGLGECRGRGGG